MWKTFLINTVCGSALRTLENLKHVSQPSWENCCIRQSLRREKSTSLFPD